MSTQIFKHMHLSLCGLANNFALTGALADSIRNRTDIHFGVYHSLFEFYNPLYLQDVANNHTTQNFVRVSRGWDITRINHFLTFNQIL